MSHRLQRHPTQLLTLQDPSKDDVGETRERISRVSSRTKPCHFYQQLGLETCNRLSQGVEARVGSILHGDPEVEEEVQGGLGCGASKQSEILPRGM